MKTINPQFVKFNNNEDLPEPVRNKYFLYISLGMSPNGMGAIYINMDNVDIVPDFISVIQSDPTSILGASNTNILEIDKDYYISETLYNIILHGEEGPDIMYLPDYIIADANVNTKYFEPVDIFSNIVEYIKNKNKYSDYEFSEDELLNFYVTFCSIILNDSVYDVTTNLDLVYKQTLNYFANYKSDSTFVSMSLIFNTKVAPQQQTVGGCGCGNNSNSGETVCLKSCTDYYISAMYEYLKTMLGSTDFYNNWFYIHSDDNELETPNKLLIDRLRKLINEFLSFNKNISIDKKKTNNCDCPTVDTSGDACNRGIIQNYLKVLDYIESNELEENTNKIKVYGEAFGELLPKL